MDPDALGQLALRARANAYAPYSCFRVGAALLTEDGSVFTAGNVENGSYGLTICAERMAVGAAVAAGHRRFQAVAIATDASEPVAPCGACRQVLMEFSPGMRVVSVAGGQRKEWSLDELLPAPFDGPEGKRAADSRHTRDPS